MERTQLHRLYVIHRAVEEGTYPNCRYLARKLEVHERTINRDLDFLRDQWGAPLEFDRRRNGWYYAGSFRLPFPRLSQGEALALLFGLNLMEQCRGTGLEPAVESLLAKLPGILPDDVSLDDAALRQGVSFSLEPARGDQQRMADLSGTLRRGITERRPVQMVYYAPARNELVQRKVDPYHLHYFQGGWYLVGYCHLRREVRTFAVDRIQELAIVTDETFPLPAFSPREYFTQAWRLERSGETAVVKVRITAYLARWLRGREYHPSQRTREEPDGSLVLTFTVRGLAEIKRWLLQFGADAEVLEPAQLRTEMAVEARKMAGKYSKSPAEKENKGVCS